MLVWPSAGAYCLFDGGLAHGVLDSAAGGWRATLLVNWWTHRPRGVCELQADDLPRLGLTALRRETAAEAAVSGVSDIQQQQQQLLPALLHRLQLGRGLLAPAVLPRCRVELSAVEGGGVEPQLVDEVLESHGLALTGCSAISGAAFDHPGLLLCPVDAPPPGECGSDAPLQTLAAFVLDDGSESTSDSSSDCNGDG